MFATMLRGYVAITCEQSKRATVIPITDNYRIEPFLKRDKRTTVVVFRHFNA